MFGRRNMLLFAILFFFAGALTCSLSKDFTTMLVGRSIQGTGAGGLLSLSEVVITDLVPLRYRGDYYGGMNAMWAVGSVLGPILGGGFSGNQHATWVCDSSTSHAAHFLMTMPFQSGGSSI
jgi:MFS family permease